MDPIAFCAGGTVELECSCHLDSTARYKDKVVNQLFNVAKQTIKLKSDIQIVIQCYWKFIVTHKMRTKC